MTTKDPLEHSLADLLRAGNDAVLPAPSETDPMVKSSIRLPVELLDWAKQEAKRRGLDSGWSGLVRELLEGARHEGDLAESVSTVDLQRAINQLIHGRSNAA